MSIPIGKKVKSTKKKSTPVGVLVAVEDGVAKVSYRKEYSRELFIETHPVEDLVQVCRETVYRDFLSNECGRPVKEGDLCGVHAGAIKRAEKAQQDRAEQERRAREYREETLVLTQSLNEQIDSRGLRVTAPSLKVLHARNGTVVLELADLLNLIRNA